MSLPLLTRLCFGMDMPKYVLWYMDVHSLLSKTLIHLYRDTNAPPLEVPKYPSKCLPLFVLKLEQDVVVAMVGSLLLPLNSAYFLAIKLILL